MKRCKLTTVMAFATLPIAAHAGDRLEIAPAPFWVTPVAIPSDAEQGGATAMKTLLQDQQLDFSDGAVTAYFRVAVTAQSADGLSKVGSILLHWNPDVEALVLHRLQLIRNGRAIDLLANGSPFTVLRREQNLEHAMLDGTLTAAFQIPDLQVGDVVELAYSRRRADPVLQGHRAYTVPVQPRTGDTHLIVHWPKQKPMRWAETPDLPRLATSMKGDRVAIAADLGSMAAPVTPKDAPARFTQRQRFYFSDFADWRQVAALMAPLYVKAAAISPGSDLAQETAHIASSWRDPLVRAEAALALVQEKVRYFFVGLDDSGFVPVDAETTWARKYGDCKAKTAVLLAMLHRLGIEAEPVAVNDGPAADAISTILPNPGAFNHVLVRATIGGKVYWLDGARRDDHDLADIPVPSYHWGLPLVSAGAVLVPVMPAPVTHPMMAVNLDVDASRGLDSDAPVKALAVYTGDSAREMRRYLAGLSAEARTQYLRDFWNKQTAGLDITTVTASFDEAKGEERLNLVGTDRLDWSEGRLELKIVHFGQDLDFHRAAGLDADAPFETRFPYATELRETITLPDNGRGYSIDQMDLDETFGGMRFERHGTLASGAATLDMKWTTIAPEFPASEAPAYQAFMRQYAREHIYLRKS